jgi:hypothetical protein
MPDSFKWQYQTVLTAYYEDINAVQGSSGDQSRQAQVQGPKGYWNNAGRGHRRRRCC